MSDGTFTEARRGFFQSLFGACRGFISIGTLAANKRIWNETFWEYPSQLEPMLEHIQTVQLTNNVYFCPMILMRAERKKETVDTCPAAWADLDACHPDNLLVQPTVVLETSPGRFQGFWVFEEDQAPEDVEAINKRIAYHHAPQGCDKSGWDLTQMLRVPLTINHKYGLTLGESPVVKSMRFSRARFRLSDFRQYPELGAEEGGEPGVPKMGLLPTEPADDIIGKFKMRINPQVWTLFNDEPKTGASWSEPLWNLLMLCLEAGMSREETFKVAKAAACNKYKRDQRPDIHLWKDVCRAFTRMTENLNRMKVQVNDEPALVTPEEMEWAATQETFVERYIKWASGLGDAAPQYHVAGAFVALSSMLSGVVRLPTSFGTMYPNVWFMILADTTLTRKSTSMDIAMDLISEVDEDILLATDGSLEGLFVGLTTRPGKPSVFLRDEFSGLLEQMSKRDYLAGMSELLTKLYDGKVQKRVLRRETLEVKDPRLIIYAGGIKSKTQEILTYEQVASGFLPRFLFITAESDITRVKPLGPPTTRDNSGRDHIKAELIEISQWYRRMQSIKLNGIEVPGPPMQWDAKLTEDAWVRYNQLEGLLNRLGVQSPAPEIYTPLYDRLGKSILKVALLLAAARQRLDGELVVEASDIVHAAFYGEQWRAYAREIITNVGKGKDEKRLDVIFGHIRRSGGAGLSRAALMSNYHLDARQADMVFTTLEQRGLITSVRMGQTTVYTAIREEV
jgi:hypothetical protein